MPFRRLTTTLLTLAALALAGVAGGAATPARASLPGNPFTVGPWWVDQHWGVANRHEEAELAAGRQGTAWALHILAATPQGKWVTLSQGYRWTRSYLERVAREAGRSTVPVFVTENLPTADCAHNRVASVRRFQRWVHGFIRGVGRHRAIVIVESDGIGTSSCLRGGPKGFRLGLIREEALGLARLPRTSVYIDGAAADWLSPGTAAHLLRVAGVAHTRGFEVNTTHYDWTANEVRYGLRVSHLLDGKHFVVNTAFNGRGPLVPGNRVRYGNEVWCNPSGRALGPLPTVQTPSRYVDAFFWVGNPGFSDGHCGNMPGSMVGPGVGEWWQSWALALVRNAAGARDFPFYRGP